LNRTWKHPKVARIMSGKLLIKYQTSLDFICSG
jgi:hypothetical protein